MVIIKVNVSEELALAFKKAAMEKFGYKKGAISMAMEEALIMWINKHKK